jgi:hypothetical protein
VLSLVSGQLNNLAVLGMLNDCPIAIVLLEFKNRMKTINRVIKGDLLQVANNLLQIIFGRNSLHGCDGFPAGSLLNSNVAEALASAFLLLELFECILLVKISE